MWLENASRFFCGFRHSGHRSSVDAKLRFNLSGISFWFALITNLYSVITLHMVVPNPEGMRDLCIGRFRFWSVYAAKAFTDW